MSPAVRPNGFPRSRPARAHQRFPFEAPVEFSCRGYRGKAVTSEIGSDAVVLATDDCMIREGTLMQMFIDWPAKLDGSHPLRLAVRGKVVHSGEGATLVKIITYEFRLRALKSASATS